MNLATLTDRQLVDLGCELRDGTFGRDPARMNKLDKMAYIRDLAPKETVETTAHRILWENGKDPNTVPKAKTTTHAPEQAPEDEIDPSIVAGATTTQAPAVDTEKPKRAPRTTKATEPQPQTVTGDDAVAAMLLHAVQAACSVVPATHAGLTPEQLGKILGELEARVDSRMRAIVHEEIAKAFQVK